MNSTPHKKPELTNRQEKVLLLFAEGKSAKEIGRELGITEPTVIKHKQVVCRKFGTENMVQAFKAYLESKLDASEQSATVPDSFTQQDYLRMTEKITEQGRQDLAGSASAHSEYVARRRAEIAAKTPERKSIGQTVRALLEKIIGR